KISDGCPELDHREERVTIVDSLGTDGKKPSNAANRYTRRWTHQASATPRIQSSSCPVRDSIQSMVSPMRPLRRRPRHIALDLPGSPKRGPGTERPRADGARVPARAGTSGGAGPARRRGRRHGSRGAGLCAVRVRGVHAVGAGEVLGAGLRPRLDVDLDGVLHELAALGPVGECQLAE